MRFGTALAILSAWFAGCADPVVDDSGSDPTSPPDTVVQPCDGETVCDDYACWVPICGGTWTMGSPDGVGDGDEQPAHDVEIATFAFTETEVTVPAWTDCLAAGACSEPGGGGTTPDPPFDDDGLCNRATQGDDDDLPANCIDWLGAQDLCEFLGGRLPSEAEWEYAARDRGADVTYPWGDDPPSCDNVILDTSLFELGGSCQNFGTYPVCSVPDGDTEQGLCDMAGNVLEWVEDWHHDSYEGAPDDGSAWDLPVSLFKVMRGGGTGSAESVRSANRVYHAPTFWYPGLGVRCVR